LYQECFGFFWYRNTNVVLLNIKEVCYAAKRSVGKFQIRRESEMNQQSKSKRVTRIEVIIIVFISLLIIGIILPVFFYVQTIYFRMRCGTNLTEIGMAILIYSNDYDDKYPRAGSESSVWSNGIANWIADDRFQAYDLSTDGNGGSASITSSFYLLVKHAEILPKTFICPGDKGVTEFKLADYNTRNKELTDFWDFGSNPREHCSFSYHMPYGLRYFGPNQSRYDNQFSLNTSSEPGMAVAADPNPWLGTKEEISKYASLLATYNPYGSKEDIKVGNTFTHKKLGQNVLFKDIHVGFEEKPFCGIDNDNIYTYWDGADIRRGGFPIPKGTAPMDRLDSFLVNDGDIAIGANPTHEERNR
jgi:hypothetical protein